MSNGSAEMTRPKSGNESRATAGYAGDLTPKDAWDLLQRQPNSVLVDCRSQAEWSFVGVPDLSSLDKRAVLVEWQSFVPGTAGAKPRMSSNQRFVPDVGRAGVSKDPTRIFLCPPGGRPRPPPLPRTPPGWPHGYNLAGGCQGLPA